jgi:crooked neck
VFERALDVDARAIQLWLTYTEMELKARNVQHARNLFDRAVTLLPRVDQLWYKYVYLEELLQNVPGARQVFERWMAWEPDDKAWQAYIKLEERYQELDRASAIYERWAAVRPDARVWVKWGKFEEERGRTDKAREVFQTALEFFGDDSEQIEKAQAVFNAFARMETRLKEYERARTIYKVGPDFSRWCFQVLILYSVRSFALASIKICITLCVVHQVRETARNPDDSGVDSTRQAPNPIRGGAES